MGLITNGHRNAYSPFRWRYGALTTIYNGGPSARNGYLAGALRDWSFSTSRQVALPFGSLNPSGWMLPQTGGGMSMRTVSHGDVNADLVPSSPMTIDFTGSGSLAASAALVVSMLAAFLGEGSITAAISGRLNATCDLTGSGDMEADLSGLANAVVAMTGAGDLEATIAAFGDMTIDIVVTGAGLTVGNVGPAVWSVLATANNIPGTMGEKLNAAGSAGDPWTTALPGSYAPGTAGDIIGNISAAPTVAEIWQHAIENGITAEEMIRAIVALGASKASGGGTNTIEFGSLDGTKTRLRLNITDADGNRNNPTIVDLT